MNRNSENGSNQHVDNNARHHQKSTSSTTSSQRSRPRTRQKNSNTRSMSSFVQQDSGVPDCSDRSGASSISSKRSQFSHRSRSSTASNINNDDNNPSNERRNMYARQDSEHSLSSSSSTSNTSYSSDGSILSYASQASNNSKFMHKYKKPLMPPKSQYVALDCEMVGILTGRSACARVVLIDWKGRTVLDQYVKPTEPITDFRTFVSGITEDQLEKAPPLEQVRPMVQAGKILIGHGLQNDLECLGIEHPWHMIRDTALYEPFMKMHYGQMNPRKLKELATERLNREIQVMGKPHSPAEDALAALDLYKSHRPRWESCMTSQIKEGQRVLVEQQKQREQYEQYFAGLPIISFP